jgi:hypothetical protein
MGDPRFYVLGVAGAFTCPQAILSALVVTFLDF